MLNIPDIMATAQGGALADNLAARFGVTPAQAQAVIAAALPHLSAVMAEPDRLPTVIKGSLQGTHRQSFEAPAAATSEPATNAGGQALKDLLGNSDVVKALAAAIAARSGVPVEQVEAMLPAIASVLLGGLWHAMSQQGFGAVLGQIGAALTQSGGARSSTPGPSGIEGALGGILSHILHKEGSTPPSGAQTDMARALETLSGLLKPAIALAADHQGEITDMLKKVSAAHR